MSDNIFILGDADRVREKIESALFRGDLAQISKLSENLTESISVLVKYLEEMVGARTIMAGGDDVLFEISKENYDESILNEAAVYFTVNSGCSISFGVAETIENAYLNLRKAKSTGGGCVHSEYLK